MLRLLVWCVALAEARLGRELLATDPPTALPSPMPTAIPTLTPLTTPPTLGGDPDLIACGNATCSPDGSFVADFCPGVSDDSPDCVTFVESHNGSATYEMFDANAIDASVYVNGFLVYTRLVVNPLSLTFAVYDGSSEPTFQKTWNGSGVVNETLLRDTFQLLHDDDDLANFFPPVRARPIVTPPQPYEDTFSKNSSSGRRRLLSQRPRLSTAPSKRNSRLSAFTLRQQTQLERRLQGNSQCEQDCIDESNRRLNVCSSLLAIQVASCVLAGLAFGPLGAVVLAFVCGVVFGGLFAACAANALNYDGQCRSALCWNAPPPPGANGCAPPPPPGVTQLRRRLQGASAQCGPGNGGGGTDVHLRHFDGTRSTCNVRGELAWMRDAGPKYFELQVRQLDCGLPEGRDTLTSCATALAATEDGASVVQYDVAGDSNVVLVDGVEWWEDPNDPTLPQLRNVTITGDPARGLKIAFASGVVVTATLDPRAQRSYYWILVSTPPSYYGFVNEGVLGNPNDDPFDDVRARDGAVLNATKYANTNIWYDALGFAKAKDEYEICQSWCLQQNETIFSYSNDTYADYAVQCASPDFYFPPATVPPDVRDFCCGDADCMLDLLGTGDVELARQGRIFGESQGRYDALAAFYQETTWNGGSWRRDDGWLEDEPCSPGNWQGVTCVERDHCTQGRIYDVTHLSVGGNDLVGAPFSSSSSSSSSSSLETKFGAHLSYLEVLDLGFNAGLSGPLPTFSDDGLGNLSSLKTLKLSNCAFEGTVPPEIAALPLETVELNGNRLEGAIPLEWCLSQQNGTTPRNLKLMYQLSETNYLCQPADCDVQVLRSCETSYREYDALSRFYEFSNGPAWTAGVEWLSGDPCYWSGVDCRSVAPWNGFRELVGVAVSSQPMDAPLRLEALADLRDLVSLELPFNGLRGSLGSSLSRLSRNLRVLDLSSNDLDGDMPGDFGSTKFTAVDLSSNPNLSGGLSAMAAMTNLTSLKMAGTSVGGRVDEALGHLRSLDAVTLHGSRFEGPIPLAWCQAATKPSELRLMFVAGAETTNLCQPASGCDLEVLRDCDTSRREAGALSRLHAALHGDTWSLAASTTWLRGDPCHQAWFGVTCDRASSSSHDSFRNLTTLRLSGLNPTGGALLGGSDLAELRSLQELVLTSMNLGGAVPTEVGDLSELRTLDLSQNAQLAGELPASLASLAHLDRLILRSNDHNGTLPEWLATLPLTYVDLRFNRFSGPVPLGWCDAPPRSLFLRYFQSETNTLCLPAGCNATDVGGVRAACLL